MNKPGTTPNIPDHELLRLIGRGSYGEVWLARNIMGTLRAIKIVYRTAFDHSRPYEREFAGLQKFEPISRTHPSQLHILHIGRNEAEGYFYYVMELADNAANDPPSASTSAGSNEPSASLNIGRLTNSGATAIEANRTAKTYVPKTLRSEMNLRGPMQAAECIEIGLSLSTALAHLHNNGLVHRDIKPSNIIYVNSQVKLADIGLVSTLDATRSYVGTVGYAPYEGPGTPQADIYSLGKVLYEAATGRDRQEFPELPTRISGTADQQQEFLELNEVLIKACDDDPRRRYQTAEQIHEDLLALRSGRSLVRLRTVERRFQLAKRVGAGALLLVLLLTPAYLYQARQTRRVKKLATENLALAQEAKSKAEEARRNELTARENLYAADISLAHQALQADNLRQARDLLNKHVPKPNEPDLRGFEWRYLWRQCQGEELFSLRVQESASSIAFSPDSRTLATGSDSDNTVKIWDIGSHRALATIGGLLDGVISVAFSERGNMLIVASRAFVRVLDAKSFQPLRRLDGGALDARFSPDGHYVVCLTTNGLALWDTRGWTLQKTAEVAGLWGSSGDSSLGVHFGLAFSPDGSRIAVVTSHGVALLGVPNLQKVMVVGDSYPRFRFVAFAPSGHTLAACTAEEKNVNLWNIDDQPQLNGCLSHSDTIFAAAFSRDGQRLATCSADQTVKLWNVANGKLLRTFRGHTNEVFDVEFSPDGNLLASVSKDGTLNVWNPSGSAMRDIVAEKVRPLGFTSDGNIVAVATNNELIAFSPETLQAQTAPNFHALAGQSNCWFGGLLTDGHTLTVLRTGTSGAQPKLELWDLNGQQPVFSVAAVSAFPTYARKRRLLAAPASDDKVSIWQLPQGQQRFVLSNCTEKAECLCFSADEALLATTSTTGEGVILWEVQENELREAARLACRGLSGLAFSPDGRALARGEPDGSLALWAVPSGVKIGSLGGHKRTGVFVAFAPDGRTLASTTDDRTVRLWHVVSQRQLMSLESPELPARGYVSLRFSPDGRTLFATEQGWLTQLMFAPSLAEIAVAEGKDYRSLARDTPTWQAVGKALEKRARFEEAVAAFQEVIERSAHEPDLQELRKSALENRAKLLARRGGSAEPER